MEKITTNDHNTYAPLHPGIWIVYQNALMETGVLWADYYQPLKTRQLPAASGSIKVSVIYEFQTDNHYHFCVRGVYKPISFDPKEVTITKRFPNFHEALLVAQNWVETIELMGEVHRQDIKVLKTIQVLNNALSVVENLPNNRRLNNAIAMACQISNFLTRGVQSPETLSTAITNESLEQVINELVHEIYNFKSDAFDARSEFITRKEAEAILAQLILELRFDGYKLREILQEIQDAQPE